MTKRKTCEVRKILCTINTSLKTSTCTPDVRSGMIMALESVLHGTGNYNGFRYLCGDEVPEDEKCGIHFANRMVLPMTERFIDTDDTRRHYF